MGELQHEAFQFTFNGFLKVAFHGSHFEALNWLFDSLPRRSHMVNATTPLVSQMVSSSQEFVEAGH